ncbi:F-box only protein 42-like [Antedon mediterranea]|uniref:F-box only protein 42-like n=1 Tax=Antedon mediterranea TaxID=105859 RepID=UPI003AF7CDFC
MEVKISNISLNNLPEEILERILWYLSPYKDCDDAARVCKVWNRLIRGIQQRRYHIFKSNTQDGKIRWSHKQCPQTPVTARHSHSACYVDGSMYIFGGSSVSETTFNDIWKLDLTSRKWSRVIASGSGPRSMPSPRASASMVYYNGSLIVFGGWAPPLPSPLYPAPRFYNELHVYSMSLNQWTAITTSLTPPPMAGHRATVIKNKMIIFGGWQVHERSNDIWVLNMDTMEWHKQAANKTKPLERSGHGQVKINDQHLLIIGGWGKNGMLCDDIWLLHMDPSLPWDWMAIKIENATKSPPEIWCHPVVKVGDAVVVYSRSKRPQYKHHTPEMSSMRTGPRPVTEFRGESVAGSNNIDNCVNGVRGSLQKNTLSNAHVKDRFSKGNQQSGELQDFPGLKCNCKWPTKLKTKPTVTAKSPLQLYILDISKVLTDHIVNWQIAAQNGYDVDDQIIKSFPLDHRPPPERISFYSVVLGQAEMVMFGGAVLDPEVGRRTTAVNSAHFAC